MSVLGKKPFVNSVLEMLGLDGLKTLKNALNSNATGIFKSLINDEYAFSEDEEYGITPCVLETKDKVYSGYLVAEDAQYVLFAYEPNSQEMKMLQINIFQKTYKIIDEELTIGEFRDAVDDMLEGNKLESLVRVSIAWDLDSYAFCYLNYTKQNLQSAITDMNNKIGEINSALGIELPYIEKLNDMNNVLTKAKEIDNTFALGRQLLCKVYAAFFIADSRLVSKFVELFPFTKSPIIGEKINLDENQNYTSCQAYYYPIVSGSGSLSMTNLDFASADSTAVISSNY